MRMPSLQHRVQRLDDARYQGGTRTSPVLALIWHATAGDTAAGARGWMDRLDKVVTPEGTVAKLLPPSKRASYTYLIDKNGDILRTVHPGIIANHAGRSAWPSLPSRDNSLNHCSLGISFANDNGSDNDPTDDDLTPEQLESGLWLGRTLISLYKIPVAHNLAHREVSPGRKFDPLDRILDMDVWRRQLGAADWPSRILCQEE
jgi:N-acetyl-anhydromuramyl-L-alanine amidase AmpD